MNGLSSTGLALSTIAVMSAVGFVACSAAEPSIDNSGTPQPDAGGTTGETSVPNPPGSEPEPEAGVDSGTVTMPRPDAPIVQPTMDSGNPEPLSDAATTDRTPPVNDGGPGGMDGGPGVLDPNVVSIMRRVADWQIPRAGGSKDWVHGAMWTGIMATYVTTKDVKYLNAVKTWAGNYDLAGGAGARGDNQCAAQTFFDTFLQDTAGQNLATMVAPARASYDQLTAAMPSGRVEWWWEDALFMVPPGFARLGQITGDKKYFTVMNAMWWDTYAFLYSTQHNLMYRDSTFFGSTTFWSRGNGWVVAGIARILQYLPEDDPKRADYAKVLNTMLAALKPLQHTDGLWPSNLLNGATGGPETSGTGFIAFAAMWGVNNGIVDRATWLPVVQKAWMGLTSHVDAAGKLGYVQNIGAAPAPATADETHEYGIGAFLLTGSELAKVAP